MKTKIGPTPSFILAPLPLKIYLIFCLMTSHLNSHTSTDINPEMLSGVQTGNGIPHDEYNIRGTAHAPTKEVIERMLVVTKLLTLSGDQRPIYRVKL